MRNLLNQLFRLMHPSLTRRFVYGHLYSLARDFFAIKECHVLLESHHGKDFGGNPYYLAAHLTSDPKYRHLRLIMVGPPQRAEWLRRQLRSPNITVVKPRSLRYAFYLATCKWLISDVTFPMYFCRRAEQKYLNTWHGTPLKVLGRHIPGGTTNQLTNAQRNFFHATWILAPNKHTESVLLDAYCLGNFCSDRMLRLGYPRIDPFFHSRNKSNSFQEFHVAFMPTWRGEMADRKSGSQQQLNDLGNLLNQLDRLLPSSVTLWVKLHPLVSGQLSLDHYRLIKLFPHDIEAYEHLATCDALVTDYSSVFFDFAATRRPIFRYISDEGNYEAERGFCLDPGSLPFPCARTPAELVALIQQLLDHPVAPLAAPYAHFLDTFNTRDLGTSARDVSYAFFESAPLSAQHQAPTQGAIRRVALYIGKPVLPPAIYVSLLEKLDTTRYSFTLLIETDAVTPEWESFLKNLDPAFLYIAIQFHAHITPLEFLALVWRGIPKDRYKTNSKTWRKIGAREYDRLFGDVELNDFISLDSTNIGSTLLENSRPWHRISQLSMDTFKNDQIENVAGLQEYYRAHNEFREQN